MTSACNCLFCPFERANVNVCDVKVQYLRKENDSHVMRFLDDKGLTNLHTDILAFVMKAKCEDRIPVGDSVQTHRGKSICTVERVSKSIYKFCFHC